MLFSKVARHLAELSKFCRLSLTDPNDHDAIKQMILDYGIDVDHSDLLIPYVNKVLEQGAMEFTETGVIDYTDMLWLPSSNYFNLEPVSLSDWTFVDEAQDLNQAQLSLVMKSRAAGGRMLFCGDRHQAIMGFAGALSNSMDQIINQTNAKILPLSICYRCPSSHVALAKELFPEIEPAPEAIEGIIENIPIDDLPSVVEENDLIICRLTAPLITQCIKLISKRIPARVRGTDIGKHLINIIEDISHFPGYSWHRFNFYLVKYLEDKIEGLKRHEDNESKIKALIDKCQGIYICYKAFRPQTLEGFCQEVQDLFSDDKPYIWLSTVHRAKGLESERVFILYPNTLPLKWDNQKPHELEQEYHLKNVALTRSKKYLAFVGGSQRPEKFYED